MKIKYENIKREFGDNTTYKSFVEDNEDNILLHLEDAYAEPRDYVGWLDNWDYVEEIVDIMTHLYGQYVHPSNGI